MKKLFTLIIPALFLFVGVGNAQTTYSWRSEATNGNWNDANNWWDGSSTSVPGGSEILSFDNDNQTSMTNNLTATSRYRIIFSSGNSSRSITGTSENTFYDFGGNSPKIENYTSVSHTIDFPIKLGYNPMEINPVNGSFVIQKSINTNGNYIDIYGTNQKSLIIESIISGSGGLTLKQNSKLEITTSNQTYTGNTTIEAGTLELSVDLASANITIKSGAKMIVKENASVSNLSIESGGVVEVEEGKTLEVTGTLTNSAGNSGLVLKSGTNGNANLIHNTNNVSGTVKTYFTGSSESWHFLSSPVTTQAISGDFTPNGSYGDGTGYDFYTWYEAQELWVNFKDGDGTNDFNTINGDLNFTPGNGYLVAYEAANPTKSFLGNLNNGTVSYNLTNDGAGEYAGTNLVGNPYPSTIDWKASSGWSRSNLATIGGGYNIYIYTGGQYGSYNSSSVSDDGTNGVSRYISSSQGFIVEADSDGGTFEMNNDVRVMSSTDFLKSHTVNKIKDYLKLKVEGESTVFSDETIIEFNHGTKLGGAKKLFSYEPSAPSIYTKQSNNLYSINFMNAITEDIVIPLGFIAGVDGQYVLKPQFIESFEDNITVFLEDKLNNSSMHNLSEDGDYSFDAETEDQEERFNIHFVKANTIGLSESYALEGVHIYANKRNIYFNADENLTNATLTVYNTIGQVVLTTNVETGSEIIRLDDRGAYIVKVQSNEGSISEKVIIK